MQVGLLPREMPRLEGYQIAARSVLASEAGGDLYDFLPRRRGTPLDRRRRRRRPWLLVRGGAGDGQGGPAEPGRARRRSPPACCGSSTGCCATPASDHSFTSLALIRLDPATGDAVLANAGHPYPLLVAGVRQGDGGRAPRPPPRPAARRSPYADREFRLPLGRRLVLCSDGLFEALDRNGNAYGFERAREVLRAMGHRPALEIVDALLNDCRRHLGDEPAPDDVTVVVVKRG